MAQVNNEQVHSKDVESAARALLMERGVTVEDIARVVYDMQAEYNDTLSMDDCYESVDRVLEKREIQHAILVGVELDKLAENNQLSQPLQQIVESDEGLFGIDETIGLGAVFGYGSIAVTTYGHLDKQKIGIIKRLDTKVVDGVHTFLDDIVASIAANASGRIAHRQRDHDEHLEDEKRKRRDEEDLLS